MLRWAGGASEKQLLLFSAYSIGLYCSVIDPALDGSLSSRSAKNTQTPWSARSFRIGKIHETKDSWNLLWGAARE